MNVAEICNRYIQFRNISAQIYNSRTFPSMVKEYEKYRFERKSEPLRISARITAEYGGVRSSKSVEKDYFNGRT